MKRMHSHLLISLLVLLFVSGPFAGVAHGQTGSSGLEVILVKAGNGKPGIDAALRPYAATLKRVFRFESYRMAGKKRLQVTSGGESVASLPGGQSLHVRSLESGSRGMKAEINWKRGGKNLLHTRINLRPESPAVLGGPKGPEGTWLLILRLN
ncbi:MAG: hypothetical protein R6V45_12375 [Oceanipulchritudo sp.]